jgi:hypothetical protein
MRAHGRQAQGAGGSLCGRSMLVQPRRACQRHSQTVRPHGSLGLLTKVFRVLRVGGWRQAAWGGGNMQTRRAMHCPEAAGGLHGQPRARARTSPS